MEGNKKIDPVTTVYQIAAKNDLNYTNYSELLDNRELLCETQQELASQSHRRWRSGAMSDEFHFQALIFALINHRDAYNHVHCGESCSSGRVVCDDPIFCQNCANIAANAFLEKTVTRFDRGHWFFLTLSFTDPVPFGSPCMDDAELCLRIVRDTYSAVAEIWNGSVYREEVAFTDCCPLVIRPHAHVLVFSRNPEFDSATVQRIYEEVARPWHYVSQLSMNWRRVNDLDDYLRTVRYLFKAADVATPYRKAWARLGDLKEGEELIQSRRQLNNEVDDLIYGVPLLRPTVDDVDFMDDHFWTRGDEGQRRVIQRGVLTGQAKRSLLLSKPEISRARARIDNILRNGSKGAKRKRARKERGTVTGGPS